MRKYWAVCVIVAVWLLFSSPYLVKNLVPFPSKYLVTFFAPWSASYGMPVKNNAMPDVITQIYPWKRVTIQSWRSGEIPLWNPYSFAGTVHAGNYQSAVFSPVNLLFFILPEIRAWSLMIVLQPLLAGWFMYVFLRSLRLSREAGVIGGLAFMFCGFITVWMAYGTLSYAALFLPFILFAVNRHMEGKAWAAPLVSLGVALSLFSGHFQISLYVILFTVVYIAYQWWKSRQGVRIVHLYISLLAGICIGAPQIFPALSAYGASGRSSSFSKGEIIPWSYLITLFAPDFYGNPVTRNDWFGHYAEWASYIGVVPLLLASIGILFSRRNRDVVFFTIIAGVCLLLALPTPLNDLMYALHIPVLSTSSASRIIILVSFSLAVLAAYGTDTIQRLWHKPIRRGTMIWSVVVMVFVTGLFVWVKLFHPLPPEKLVVAVRNLYLPALFAILAVISIFSGFFIPKRWKIFLIVGLLSATAFDVYRYASKWMPFEPKEYVYPGAPVLSFLSGTVKPTYARISGNLGNEVTSAFGIQNLEGYDAVFQKRYGQFISAATDGKIGALEHSVVLLNKQGIYTEDINRLLGVRYLVHRISDGRFSWAYPFWNFPSYHSIWKGDTYEIFENTAAFPRVFLASSYQVVRGDQQIVDVLFSAKTDRREKLILEKEPDIKPQMGEGTATIVRYDPNNVIIQTQSAASKLLFLSDVFDPGWNVTVDGKSSVMLRADFDFRAVAIPAGRHIVAMQYWPQFETWAFVVSGFGTLWCIGYLLYRKNRYENRSL